MTISVRVGDNLDNMGPWSPPVAFTGAPIVLADIGIITPGRYLEYTLALTGNAGIGSPAVSGVHATYVAPRTTTIMFQPLYLSIPDDEYVSEIVISQHADIPATSTIQYGVVQEDTLNEAEFFSSIRPVRAGGRTILLSRSDEPMATGDNINFTLVCGSWPAGMEVEVYRTSFTQKIPSAGSSSSSSSSSLSGKNPGAGMTSLVDPSEYTLNPAAGTVAFSVPQDVTAILSAYIILPPVLRMICSITNRSDQPNQTARIHNISVMYNTTTLPPRK